MSDWVELAKGKFTKLKLFGLILLALVALGGTSVKAYYDHKSEVARLSLALSNSQDDGKLLRRMLVEYAKCGCKINLTTEETNIQRIQNLLPESLTAFPTGKRMNQTGPAATEIPGKIYGERPRERVVEIMIMNKN